MGIRDWFNSKKSVEHNPLLDAPMPVERGLPEVTVDIPMPPVKKPRKPKKTFEDFGLSKEEAESLLAAQPPKKPRKPRAKKKVEKPAEKFNPEKEAATLKGEPWVGVLDIELDVDNVGTGAFNLDWNDKFVAKLVRAGYRGKNDQEIVDQWFQTICRSVLAETYEQEQADPENRKNNK